ncbi:MAG: hypothetical protein HY851_04795 [candidate division Zixibacteria bacterium]|nr:hypothetical protein [candidate division Zixibacteria bacterium]
MKATVIEVSDTQIYLQVGDQLRFKAHYETDGRPRLPHRADTVDFDFHRADIPAVVIHTVVPQSRRGFVIG